MIESTILEKLTPITPEEQQILNGSLCIDRSLYMDDAHDVVSGDRLLGKGKLIDIRPHTRFIDFPEHSHDYVEMVYMCAGSTLHMVNGTEILLKEGELLILGRNARQSIRAAGRGDIAVNFLIRPEFFSDTLHFLGAEETPLRRFVVDCLCGGEGESCLYFPVSGVLPVKNLVENLLWTLLSDVPNRRGIYQLTMGLLFTQLLNCTDRLQLMGTEQGVMLRVLNYIETNYKTGSLSELSQELHYDLTWMSRFIRQRTGKTFTELLQDRRLTQAAWLLKNTDHNVDTIASEVGYENMSYFHRIFAARFSMSPRSYRINCK